MPFEQPGARFDVVRPQYLSDDYWGSIKIELSRLHRSLDNGDSSQVIGDIKCLVESVAKITLDINGTPAEANASYDATVNKAHDLLRGQPGHEIARQSEYGKIATQASKIARGLGNIRNSFGAGHGRPRQPHVNTEMVELALDGGLLWVRWALRRIGLFSIGRPNEIIRDLIGFESEPMAVFYKGDLYRRLEAANIPDLEPQHQRRVGVAVGQRAANDTWTVIEDGVSRCVQSEDTKDIWTRDYRIGLAHGLLFDINEGPTITDARMRNALGAFLPLTECANEVEDLVQRVVDSTDEGGVVDNFQQASQLNAYVNNHKKRRPVIEHTALSRLAHHVQPYPF